MKRVAAAAAALIVACPAPAAELALVLRDEVGLRAAPGERARPHAFLWQGEIVEVRGEAPGFLRVYDYRRERGGYVIADRVRRLSLGADAAPELLAVLRFLRDAPGSEALGLGFAAAYLEAAPAETLNGPAGVDALDAIGALAGRLAARASAGVTGRVAQRALAAHLDVAARHGVQLVSFEKQGRLRFCYDGAAYRRVLAMPARSAQQARAALALTNPACIRDDLGPAGRRQLDEWRAQVLDKVDTGHLSALDRNRVLIRSAAVWAGLAYRRAREGADGRSAAARALQALAGVDPSALTRRDREQFSASALRVGASRWALSAAPPAAVPGERPHVVTRAEVTGETCVFLVDGKHGPTAPLAKRCTYGLAWIESQTLNREGNALALSVQQTDAWLELWVFRKSARGWTVGVLPPAATTPGLGYAEFAGWLPGGIRMLVAREAQGNGRRERSFEVLRLDTLAPVRHASRPAALAEFRRWQDPAWKARTLSLR
ncbi:MAG TPA: hypothetical protein VFV84_00975 [Burkholderiales bacterium]|nr:hypothetical protein [Burkholderiales bacterium]